MPIRASDLRDTTLCAEIRAMIKRAGSLNLVGLVVGAAALAMSVPAHPIDARAAEFNGDAQLQFKSAILLDRDRRTNPDASTHIKFGATGLVRCGNTVGTAELVLHHDLIVTAAHVLLGPTSGHGGDCVFTSNMGDGSPIPIVAGTIKAGSRTPLAQPATRDWAVARLAAPVLSAIPYSLAAQGAHPTSITLCAGGNGTPTHFGAESCAVRRIIQTSADGIRELAIDCSASPGSSGAGLVTSEHTIAAIYIGYRSTNPDQSQPFSDTHYNFAITIDGPFRRAISAEAARHTE
jgi:V8-like Glu-specific endopeptidase